MQRTFDVRAVGEQFPALGRKHNGRQVVYLDGPGGSQIRSTPGLSHRPLRSSRLCGRSARRRRYVA
jgi:hypothetical protein